MIKIFTNCEINNQNTYLIINNNEAVLIDAGSLVTNVITYLKKNKIKLQAVIITHGHYDHINGLNILLKQFPKLDLYMHQEDVRCLTNYQYNLSILRYPVGFTVNEKIVNLHYLTAKTATLFLIGYHFIIEHNPGHTPGSQYIIVEELNAIFIGDTIFKDKIGFFELPYADPKTFKKSLIKILNLSINYDVYPGHHQPFKLQNILNSNKILDEFIKKE